MKTLQVRKQSDSWVLLDTDNAVVAFGFPTSDAAIKGAMNYGAELIVLETADDRIRHDWDVNFNNILSFRSEQAIPVSCKMNFCHEQPFDGLREHESIKVDTSAVSEAIRQVLEVSDTSRILIELLARRDAHGKAKYGTSLDRTDLSLVDWLQHQTEELLDGAGYAQAAKREAEKLLALEGPLRKLIGHLQENPPRIHNPSLRALVDLLQ